MNFLLALSEAELKAVDRALGAMLSTWNPQVLRELHEALGGIPLADLRRGAAHIHGALLAAQIPEEAAG